MDLIITHYLPPVSFGGCEDVALTLAARRSGLLYCPRSRNYRPPFISRRAACDAVYEKRGLPRDRIFFIENEEGLRARSVDRVFLVGLYWPRVTIRGLLRVDRRVPVYLIPLLHVSEGPWRVRDFVNELGGRRIERVIAVTYFERDYLKSIWSGCRDRIVCISHLPSICVPNEDYLPAPDPADGAGGYILFPSRACKGLSRARELCRGMGLPLLGNRSYAVDGLTDGVLDFDRCDPYKGARCVISLGRSDSYNLAVAKAMHRRVPAVWDDGNMQIREIWSEFNSAIPVSRFDGWPAVDRAAAFTEESRAKMDGFIHTAWDCFLDVIGR